MKNGIMKKGARKSIQELGKEIVEISQAINRAINAKKTSPKPTRSSVILPGAPSLCCFSDNSIHQLYSKAKALSAFHG